VDEHSDFFQFYGSSESKDYDLTFLEHTYFEVFLCQCNGLYPHTPAPFFSRLKLLKS